MIEEDIKYKINHVIESSKKEIFNDLQRLVQMPSITGSEGEAQEYMQEKFSQLYLKVEKFEANPDVLREHEAYIETEWGYKNRPNIIGILEGDSSGKSLILNGHIDVVSPEPVSEWSHSPWSGKIVDTKLFGRGSLDMKAGLIANYWALKSILELGITPKGTVLLESVIEEEAGGAGGTLACFMNGYKADGFIATEQGPGITVASVGVSYFKVRVFGKSQHAGLAHKGVNAIGKLNKIYDALMELDKKRAKENKYPFLERTAGRSCHLNIGKYRAGDWPSTVPGFAELHGRISFVPGETMDDVKDQVKRTIDSVSRNDKWLQEHPPELEWFGWQADPWEQSADDDFVKIFKSVSERTLKQEVDFVAMSAGLDARFGQYFAVPSLSFGPIGDNIHGVDEYVDLPSLIKCIRVLAMFIKDWCGVKK